ncbi:hypothetical protein ACFL2Q_13195 [Thermodesulfobacteriota bacterium]
MAGDECRRCFGCLVEDLAERVEASPMASVQTGWEFSALEGSTDSPDKVVIRSVQGGEQSSLDAAALVVATGFEPYDPTEKILLGYGRYEGVMTLAELDGVVRDDNLASLGAEVEGPVKIALLQCIGSRDAGIGADYCSQYCCRAALRMALRVLDEQPEWEVTVFYIDLQLAGKYAGELLSEARSKNVRLVQGVPGEVLASDDGMLRFYSERDGLNVKEEFHHIVLSVGQRAPTGASDLASGIGLDTDEFGFFSPRNPLDAGRTQVGGVYLAGCCAGPKDIERTLVHAGQTAAAIIADLNGSNRVP